MGVPDSDVEFDAEPSVGSLDPEAGRDVSDEVLLVGTELSEGGSVLSEVVGKAVGATELVGTTEL